jgi:hypothetical protein
MMYNLFIDPLPSDTARMLCAASSASCLQQHVSNSQYCRLCLLAEKKLLTFCIPNHCGTGHSTEAQRLP